MKCWNLFNCFRPRAIRIIFPTVLIVGMLFAVTRNLEASEALEKVRFGTGSRISLTSAPLTMAMGMGFFKEEG